MFISSFLELWTTNKSKNFQKSKKSKKSLLVTFIAWFKSWFKSLDLNQANPAKPVVFQYVSNVLRMSQRKIDVTL